MLHQEFSRCFLGVKTTLVFRFEICTEYSPGLSLQLEQVRKHGGFDNDAWSSF